MGHTEEWVSANCLEGPVYWQNLCCVMLRILPETYTFKTLMYKHNRIYIMIIGSMTVQVKIS
jgi:hypothetical protein